MRCHGNRDPGLSVRARPHPNPAPSAGIALRSRQGGLQLGLALVKARLAERQSDLSIQVPLTLPELRREWNRTKDQVAPWWAENSKEAYNSGLDGLARALKNFSDSKQGRRKGRQMGFPRRKTK